MLPWWEKYAPDWTGLQDYPLWSVRDRGKRLRPLLRLCLYAICACCPFTTVRQRYKMRAAEYLRQRPYLRAYLPLSWGGRTEKRL